MRWVNFALLLLIVFCIASLGATHDASIIKAGCSIPELAKWIGNGIELLAPLGLCVALGIVEKKYLAAFFACVSCLFAWWIVHDVVINIKLDMPIDYIGHGAFDQYFGAVFLQKGWLYLAFRGFVLLLFSAGYLKLAKWKK